MQQSYLRSANAIQPVPLSTYLLLTFCSAWLIWSPLLVAEYLHLTLPVPSLVFITLGSFVPSIIALFLTWRYAGGTELRRLLGQVLIWRVSPIWYVIAIAGPALIMLLATGIHVLLGGTAPDYVPFGSRWLIVAVNFVLVLLIGGEHVDDTIDGFCGALRVERAEDQMAGTRRRDGEFDGLPVAHFPHQNKIGIFAQRPFECDLK